MTFNELQEQYTPHTAGQSNQHQNLDLSLLEPLTVTQFLGSSTNEEKEKAFFYRDMLSDDYSSKVNNSRN